LLTLVYTITNKYSRVSRIEKKTLSVKVVYKKNAIQRWFWCGRIELE
jgi:hypothetical protein